MRGMPKRKTRSVLVQRTRLLSIVHGKAHEQYRSAHGRQRLACPPLSPVGAQCAQTCAFLARDRSCLAQPSARHGLAQSVRLAEASRKTPRHHRSHVWCHRLCAALWLAAESQFATFTISCPMASSPRTTTEMSCFAPCHRQRNGMCKRL